MDNWSLHWDPQNWVTVIAAALSSLMAFAAIWATQSRRGRVLLGLACCAALVACVPAFISVNPYSIEKIRLLQPSAAVDGCQRYNGVGEIPNGYTLLIFNIAVNQNGSDDANSLSYMNGRVEGSDATWETPVVGVGEPFVKIYGKLVPSVLADYLLSIKPVDGAGKDVADGGWLSAKELPGDSIKPIVVSPKTDSKPC